MLRPLFLLLFLWIALVCGSCKSDIPEDVMDEQEMEDVLYDYHLAQAAASLSADSVAYKTRLYCAAVFRKYGISEKDFNHSLQWYTRHADVLYEIYGRLDERFSASSSALGISASSRGNLARLGAQGDTANVWQGKVFYLLSSNYLNRMSFVQLADTAYHPGDRLEWHFNVSWIYREGMKSATAVLAVRYDNDSVASSTQSIYSSGQQQVSLLTERRPVKEISGFIYQNAEWSDKPKLMLISSPALIRFHERPAAVLPDSSAVSGGVSDTLRADSASLHRPDTVHRPSPRAFRSTPTSGRTFTLRREPQH